MLSPINDLSDLTGIEDDAHENDVLRENEERYRLVVEAGHIGTCDWNYQTDLMHRNTERFRMYGMEPQDRLMHYREFLAVVHPEDRERVNRSIHRGIEERGEHSEEYRIVRRGSGIVRWTAETGCVATRTEGGKPLRIISVLFDITDRTTTEEALEAKVAERTQELRELTRRLASTQEEERRRLSREMHDQTGQQMTGLLLLLRNLRDAYPPESGALSLLDRVDETAGDLAHDIHRIAVELRPPALDDIGLITALGNYIGQWSERTGIQAAFEHVGVDEERLPDMPDLVEITIYRVVQEALNNVAKHTAATEEHPGAHLVSVTLQQRGPAEARVVRVAIEDDGPGFDVEEAAQGRLGLSGMRERAESCGGTIEVESTPGEGTTIFLRVPL